MLDTFLKLNSSRAGHDKLIRTVQYACKLIAATSSSHSHKYDDLARMIGATRRFLRLGTCVDALYSSFLSVSHPDSFVRMTVTLSHIANAMYLFCDHLLFLHHNKLLRINVKKWDNLSDRGPVLALLHRHGPRQKHLSDQLHTHQTWNSLIIKLSPLLHGEPQKFNR